MVVSKDEFSSNVIEQMTDVIHQGPDAVGHYNLKHLSLGHARLAIVDLSVLAIGRWNTWITVLSLSMVKLPFVENQRTLKQLLFKKRNRYEVN